MRLSVIIPTRNRVKTLENCLNALLAQNVSRDLFEIIVVDDGSNERLSESIFMKAERQNIKIARQEHGGPARARNKGMEMAAGKIVLFMGDDIIADRGLVGEHIRWHSTLPDANVAVLGHVAWIPSSKNNIFLEWLDQGAQFGYGSIPDSENVSYDYFYTSNISLKKKFLERNGCFDEGFKYAAFEDIELGYRLWKKGLRIIYKKEALGYHDHVLDKGCFLERTKRAGKALRIFVDKHPELREKYIPEVKNEKIKKWISKCIWYLPVKTAGIFPKKLLYVAYDHYMFFSLQESSRE